MQGKRLSGPDSVKYSACKQIWPRAYTDHILKSYAYAYPDMIPGPLTKKDSEDRYLGHKLSRKRRKASKKSSRGTSTNEKVERTSSFF